MRKPWAASLGVDLNDDGVLGDGDVGFGEARAAEPDGRYRMPIELTECNYVIYSADAISTCGQLATEATFAVAYPGDEFEITRRIPKREISRNGRHARFIAAPYNTEARFSQRCSVFEYEFAVR